MVSLPQQQGMESNMGADPMFDPMLPEPKAFLPKIKGILDSYIQRFVVQEVETEKQINYAEMRRCFLYWDTKQFLVPQFQGGLVTDWQPLLPPGLLPISQGQEYDSRGKYDTPVNMVRGDGNKVIAVLGARSPNPKATAMVDTIECMARANRANRILACLRKLWDVNNIHRKLTLFAWRDGTFYLYTPLEKDETGTVAPGIFPHNEYTVTVPFYVEDFKRSPWLRLEYEANKGEIVDQYPELLDQIEGAEESLDNISQAGMWSRSVLASLTGDLRKISLNRWTYIHCWLQPCMYNFFGKQMQDGIYIRDWFKQKFPRGCKLVQVGSKVVDIVPESFLDVWAVGQPGVSSTVHMPGICRDFLPIQDVINNVANLNQENIERGIPITVADPQVINTNALNSRSPVPGEVWPAEAGSSGRLRDAMVDLKVAEYQPEAQQFAGEMLALGRENSGVLPAIFGGGDSNTAREADIKKTQALMQLSLVWFGLIDAWKGAYTNGTIMLSKFGADVLRDFGLSELDIQMAPDLINPVTGKLNGIAIEIDESIPATPGQQKDAVMFLMQSGPEVMQTTGATDPINAGKIQDALGIPSWKTPGSSVREYVQREIKFLSQEQPITQQAPPPPLDAYGMPLEPPMPPPPPMPSRQPDNVLFEPIEGLMVAREWLTSEEGQMVQENNPAGWENVRLWAQACMMMMQPPMGPMGPPPEEGPEGASLPSPPMEENLPTPGSMGPDRTKAPQMT